MTFSKREVVLVVVAAALVAAFGAEHLVRAIYLPRRTTLSTEIKKHERLLARNARLATEADRIRTEYEQMKSRRVERTHVKSEAAVLREIERVADEGVKLRAVNPLSGGRASSTGEASVALQFSGDLGDVGDFVAALAQQMGGEFSMLSLAAAERPAGTVQCQATCTFVLAPDEVEGSSDASQ